VSTEQQRVGSDRLADADLVVDRIYEGGKAGEHRGRSAQQAATSLLRHRQFGVLVTTSHVDSQAYREIRDDGHPVVILAGRDVVDMLKRGGFDTPEALRKHLVEKYP
jgi:Restriction endonuclease